MLKRSWMELRERNEIKYDFIHLESTFYPVIILCGVMGVSTSAFYDWLKRPAPIMTGDTLRLYRRMKQLFEQSRGSLGSR